jgi:hypothetical protein
MNIVSPVCALFFVWISVFAFKHYSKNTIIEKSPKSRIKTRDSSIFNKDKEVFISYSGKEIEKILPLVERIESFGVTVWFDKKSIDGAAFWKEEIVDAIENCKVLIFFVSENSVISHNVVKEVTLATEFKKHILPVYFEKVIIPNKMRYQLTGLQRLDYYKSEPDQVIESIMRSLVKLGVKANFLDSNENSLSK